jgi:hypothetical protein
MAFPCSRPLLLSLFGLALLLASCDKDEITHYKVPKVVEAPEPERPKAQLLGAIVPHGDDEWFFKLVGPVEPVREREVEFQRFVESIRFADKADVPEWKTPEGWREQKVNDGVTYAAFRLGPDERGLQMTVTRLPRKSGLLANVNRWRGQLGLRNLAEADLDSVTKKIDVAGVPVTMVSMVGTMPGAKMPPFAKGKLPPGHPPAARPGLKYTKPDDWKEVGRVEFSVATFLVGQGDQMARVTVSPLSGPAGGLLENVNRWRGQVGLNPLTEEGLRRESQKITVAGTEAIFVDAAGKEGRILGVVVPRDGQTWFIKMTGSTDLVGKQKAAFEAFVKSVRFE